MTDVASHRPRGRRPRARLGTAVWVVVTALVVLLWASLQDTAARAAVVSLTDDAGGLALFPGPAPLSPGAPLSSCLSINAAGAAAGDEVRIAAESVTGTLAPWILVGVDVGTGGGHGNCAGFVGSRIYSGSLIGLASVPGDGLATGWYPAVVPTRTFRVTVDVANSLTALGRTAGATFSWRLVPVAAPPGPAPTSTAASTSTVTATSTATPTPSATPTRTTSSAPPTPRTAATTGSPHSPPAPPASSQVGPPSATAQGDPIPPTGTAPTAPTAPTGTPPTGTPPTGTAPTAPTGTASTALPTTELSAGGPGLPPGVGPGGRASPPSPGAAGGAAGRGPGAGQRPDLRLFPAGIRVKIAQALLGMVTGPAPMLWSGMVAALFLLVQYRLDASDPKLVGASRSRRELMFRFPDHYPPLEGE